MIKRFLINCFLLIICLCALRELKDVYKIPDGHLIDFIELSGGNFELLYISIHLMPNRDPMWEKDEKGEWFIKNPIYERGSVKQKVTA